MLLYKKLNITFFLFFYITVHAAKPLKILFVVGHFPVSSQIFILNIMTEFIDQGHDVSIFSFHRDELVDVHPNIEKYNLLEHVIYGPLPENLPNCDVVFCQFGYLGKMMLTKKKLVKWLKKRKMVVCFRGAD